jgi:chemotaxis protein methyltransferase CheR
MSALLRSGSAASSDQPDPFDVGELSQFGQAISTHFGHFQDLSRQQDLAAILRQRMRLNGCSDYSTYQRTLETAAEWEALAPLLTVAETYFFRMPSHFEALAEDVLPRVIEANRKQRSLRILSAGCATGEEPYTLRILLNERFPQLRDWDVSIVGVDLSLAALERARAGVYTDWSLRATSAERRSASFTVEEKRFRIRPTVRAGVTFRRENLLALPPDEPPFDIIFCRNVLIYFTDDAIREAIARLTERLRPSGYLFLGPAESLRGISNAFELRQGHEVVYYRLRRPEDRRPVSATFAPRTAVAVGGKVQLTEKRSSHRPEIEAERLAAAMLDDGAWYTSIQQSWNRLAAMVPGEPLSGNGPVPAPELASAAGLATAGGLATAAGLAKAAGKDETFFALVAAERFAQALDVLETMTSGAAGTFADSGIPLLRASMLTNLGRYGDAERECQRLLAADPVNPGASFLLGLCREQAGALREAEEHMARTTYLDPTFLMAHLHRGLIARRQHRDADANVAFRHALGAIENEDDQRLALFGGGFSRESLRQLCLRALEERAPRPGAGTGPGSSTGANAKREPHVAGERA